MRVEKRKVRASGIGRVWLNSSALSFRQLRGRVVLVDFWDYTCVKGIRTLPYVQAGHERYKDKGLTAIGVHTPEFTFAQYQCSVERGIRELGLTYPIVVDSNREIGKAFANRYWNTQYLLDRDGYLRHRHFGEGDYAECEEAIQELLHEVDPTLTLPQIMEPWRERIIPELCVTGLPANYLGHGRGRTGNEGGFQEDQIADCEFDNVGRDLSYGPAAGLGNPEYFEAAGEGPHSRRLKYEASAVNLVMAAPRGAAAELELLPEGEPLARRPATKTLASGLRTKATSWSTPQASMLWQITMNSECTSGSLDALRAERRLPVAWIRWPLRGQPPVVQNYETGCSRGDREGWKAVGVPAHPASDDAVEVGVSWGQD